MREANRERPLLFRKKTLCPESPYREVWGGVIDTVIAPGIFCFKGGAMKKVILIAAMLLAACATTSQEKTYDVWERPGKNDRGTVPAYRAKEMPNGEMRVYKYGDPFEYKYRVEPNGRIYKYGNPFEPVGHIKNGLPTTDKRGK